MQGEGFDEDPQPELPSCFSSVKQVQGLLRGLPAYCASYLTARSLRARGRIFPGDQRVQFAPVSFRCV
jgi:hypothetical protein